MCAPLVMEEVAKKISRRAFLGAGAGLLAGRALAQAQVPPAGALLFVGRPKHQGASGGPVRAVAVW